MEKHLDRKIHHSSSSSNNNNNNNNNTYQGVLLREVTPTHIQHPRHTAKHSRDEGGEEVEEVYVVLLVHSDTEGAGVTEATNVQEKGNIAIPHVIGVIVSQGLVEDHTEVLRVTDGRVSKRSEDWIARILAAGEAVVSPV